jgi:ABC-type polysaccharide/polyol phosphate export permease
MTAILDAYRDVLIRGKLPDLGLFSYAAGLSILFLTLGWIAFYKMQYKFAEKI